MNRFKTSVRVAIMAILTVSPVGLAACATANEAPNAVDAILLNSQDSATREAIRIFVREKSGANVIAMPDSLSQTPLLKNHQREVNLGGRINTPQSFTPTGNYRLVIDENRRCWLVHRLGDAVSNRPLPESANCMPYPRALK